MWTVLLAINIDMNAWGNNIVEITPESYPVRVFEPRPKSLDILRGSTLFI